jgi:hypothetical protein
MQALSMEQLYFLEQMHMAAFSNIYLIAWTGGWCV